MSPALIVALPFLGALLPGLMIRAGRDATALMAGAATALALLGLLLHLPAVLAGEVITAQFTWLPGLGMNANFMIDGLGMLFGTLILGIGLLIILYARFYLPRSEPLGRFYTFLLLFQGAMTGIVLSDNILLLLVFWELTSLSSFLLIGWWQHEPEARRGARMALAITGAGGLAMIAGLMLLGQIAGSNDLSIILTEGAAIRESDLFVPALLLILLGAFTKSAQFPFHFWLPHAMAAPTPVSAYLHSATMVKAGIFLMARLWPVLSGSPEWVWIVSGVGLVTMVLGACVALFQHDLKGLLAYSTVSHLGLITMLLGFGTTAAATAAMFHILVHASFKAALFMAAGIIDHETHTRDIRRLGGLRHSMPITFAIVVVAALSMAGIPPLNGFLSKELMLEQVWDQNLLMAVLAVIGAGFSVAYSLRLIAHVFLGPERLSTSHGPHDPGFGLWLAPGLLAVLVVLMGLWPMGFAAPWVQAAASAVTGTETTVKIALWHGLVPALGLSVAAVVAGVLLLRAFGKLEPTWAALPRPDGKAIFTRLLALLETASDRLSNGLHNGSLSRYLAVFTAGVVIAGWLAWRVGGHAPGLREPLPIPGVIALGWLMLIVAALLVAILHRQRLLALMVLGVVGLIVSLGFIYISAPDLALTQISVEVVSVVLLLLALNFLPKTTPVESSLLRRGRDILIAGVAGLATGGLALAIMLRDLSFPTIADYHIANSYTGGGGTNVVNVILVDFRGYDTMGEIIVLGIAGLLIYALVESLLGTPNLRRIRRVRERESGDRHPMMLVVAGRMMLPLMIMVGLYIFLRGHNEPGGGFVAGLIVSIALVVQFMASGFAWTQARQPIDYHGFIGAGVLCAVATGFFAWFAGRPFLTSAYGYVQIPPMEKFELATAMGFDLGVFLTVVGAVMLALHSLSRIAQRLDPQATNTGPMDGAPKAPAGKGN